MGYNSSLHPFPLFQYQNDCNFAVPQYLMAGGGLNIAFAGFWLIAKYTSCEWDDKYELDIIKKLHSGNQNNRDDIFE